MFKLWAEWGAVCEKREKRPGLVCPLAVRMESPSTVLSEAIKEGIV